MVSINLVNIGLVNGLLTDGADTLTYVAFITTNGILWHSLDNNFQKAFTTHDSYNEYEITLLKLQPHLPRDNYLKKIGRQSRFPLGYFLLKQHVLTTMALSAGKLCGLIWDFCV